MFGKLTGILMLAAACLVNFGNATAKSSETERSETKGNVLLLQCFLINCELHDLLIYQSALVISLSSNASQR